MPLWIMCAVVIVVVTCEKYIDASCSQKKKKENKKSKG